MIPPLGKVLPALSNGCEASRRRARPSSSSSFTPKATQGAARHTVRQLRTHSQAGSKLLNRQFANQVVEPAQVVSLGMVLLFPFDVTLPNAVPVSVA